MMKKRPLAKILPLALGLMVLSGILVFFAEAKEEAKKGDWVQVEYTSSNLRDPFKSPFDMDRQIIPRDSGPAMELPTIKPVLSHLTVEGMLWGGKMPQAIINNQIVKPGDIIEGAEIVNVTKEGVQVLYKGFEYTIRPSTLEDD